jgi:hypothetical protein
VLGNVSDLTGQTCRWCVPCPRLCCALADDDPLLRAHAVWSARRLGCDDLLVDLTGDPDPEVQAELAPRRPAAATGAVPVTVGPRWDDRQRDDEREAP